MNIRSKLFLSLAILFIGLAVYGCGTKNTGVTTVDKPVIAIVSNAQTKQFNQQLGAIKDQQSAETAVNSFVDYVGTRVKPTGGATDGHGVAAAAIRAFMTPPVVSAIARRELIARNIVSATASGTDDGTDAAPLPLVDTSTLTNTVNQLGADQGVRVDSDTVDSAKTAVEGSIPNLNPTGSAGMTPLNAMVVGYALTSGDDGTASAESVPLPTDKVNAFMNVITQ